LSPTLSNFMRGTASQGSTWWVWPDLRCVGILTPGPLRQWRSQEFCSECRVAESVSESLRVFFGWSRIP